MIPCTSKRALGVATGIVLLLAVAVLAQNDDRFWYGPTNGRLYGPNDWNQVSCDNVEVCEGWPDKWLGQTSPGWDLGQLGNECGRDLQGPLNLERQTGIPGDRFFECIDVHWMKYHDGACNWKDMVDNQESKYRNNFHIRRHALTVASPLGTDGELDCPNGFGGHYPQLDYSKGYPEWWYLSHMDIKTPAEWLQDGIRYDGQINYAQFYERDYTTQDPNGPLKRDGTVVIFFKAYEDVLPDPFMDKMICQFRKTEDEVRENCGLPSVTTTYPGCWNYQRNGRRLRKTVNTTQAQPDMNHPWTSVNMTHAKLYNSGHPKDFDFDKFIEEQIAMGGGNGNWTLDHPWLDPKRHLVDYEHVPWHAYQFLVNVRTEYYFRVRTSQTVPPCQTGRDGNHYRVMKDPLRLHPRQVAEVERLLAERIAPVGTRNVCNRDTAGVPMPGVKGGPAVRVARPTQRYTFHAKMTFCECKDWPSKWPEDREWCEIGETNDFGDFERYYERPYNYDNGEKLTINRAEMADPTRLG